MIFFGLALITGGCEDEDTIVCDECPSPDYAYRPSTSPENVLHNLQAAYLRRGFDKYAELLAPEFTFWFQPADARDLGAGFWTRDQDSTQTAALFREPRVTQIDINLRYEAAVPDTQAGRPPGAMHIRVKPTFLEVDEVDNGITTTWRVNGDIQDFYFRPGQASAGEDTTRWYLFEWKDVPAGATVSPRVASKLTTWGRIKSKF